MSVAELEVLAGGVLATSRQTRLDELLIKNSEGAIPAGEQLELDHLLEIVDQLNLRKARARFTLNHLKVEAAGS